MMKSILVIDDDPDILHIVTIILTGNNFTVKTVSAWENIFPSLKLCSPDLILLDVMLGGADGREICKQLKNNSETQDIPVILFSANYNLKNNLNNSKPDDIIAKPFESAHLIETINKYLN